MVVGDDLYKFVPQATKMAELNQRFAKGTPRNMPQDIGRLKGTYTRTWRLMRGGQYLKGKWGPYLKGEWYVIYVHVNFNKLTYDGCDVFCVAVDVKLLPCPQGIEKGVLE